MSEHSLFSLSARPRWSVCSAAWYHGQRYEDTTSPAAKEGLGGHHWLEVAIKEKLTRLDSLVGSEHPEHGKCTAEHAENLNPLLQIIDDHRNDGYVVSSERRLNVHVLPVPPDDIFGTADVTLVSADGAHVMVIDLKYGRRAVSIKENKQLLGYGLALYDETSLMGDVERVTTGIWQPRVYSTLQTETYDAARMEDERDLFGGEVADCYLAAGVIEHAKSSKEHSGYEVPGEEQCRWCRHVTNCNAVAVASDDLVTGTDAAIEEWDPALLDKTIRSIPVIRKRCDEIEKAAIAAALNGAPIKGHKLVKGRKAADKWIDEEAAIEELKSMRLRNGLMYAQKLKTPTQLLKGGDIKPRQVKRVQKHVFTPDSKLRLVPEEAPEESVTVGVTAIDFIGIPT